MELTLILVAVNTVDGRDAAFTRALALAHESGAELYVLHAVPLDSPYSFRSAERRQRFAEMRRRAEDAGVRVRTAEQSGDPAEIIDLHATALGADLIVLGAQPRRPWSRGRSSIAERLVRRATLPVLVVATASGVQSNAFRNVLVAVDLTLASAPVAAAVRLLTTGPAKVTLMHSVNDLEAEATRPSLGWWLVPEYRQHILADTRQALATLRSMLPQRFATSIRAATGPVVRAIFREAAAGGCDVVVVGRSRRFRLFGDTVIRILRSNDRELLIVPTTRSERPGDSMDKRRASTPVAAAAPSEATP